MASSPKIDLDIILPFLFLLGCKPYLFASISDFSGISNAGL